MKFPTFYLERWQSLREYKVRINLAESGVYPLAFNEFGIEIPLGLRLGYTMTKGSKKLREIITSIYEKYGITEENILVTNGTAEANLLSILIMRKMK